MIEQIAEAQRPYEELIEGRQIYMFGFIDQIENCVISCKRLFKLFEALAKDITVGHQDRIAEIFDPQITREVTDFRNTIEHMEERIVSGQISDMPVVIQLSGDGESIVIGSECISLRDLADTLTRFHSAGLSLVPEFLPKP